MYVLQQRKRLCAIHAAVLARCHSKSVLEHLRKLATVFKTDFSCDLQNPVLILQQQDRCLFHTFSADVLMDRHTVRVLKADLDVGRRIAELIHQLIQCNLPVKIFEQQCACLICEFLLFFLRTLLFHIQLQNDPKRLALTNL